MNDGREAARLSWLRDVVRQACARESGQRRAWLDEACGDDAELRREAGELLDLAERLGGEDVEGLLSLAARVNESGFLEADPTSSELRRRLHSTTAPLPRRVGPHRVVRRLGEGAMGVVFEAEQDRPRRRVAVKVLSTTDATGTMHRRIEREAELLARLDHPGIVRVLDAGIEEDAAGRPRAWIAMELVDGVPLTHHASTLALREKLELLRDVAAVVAHAHRHGVVHRDLKPQNVLIDTKGQVKVLDFGVARAVGQDETALTRAGDVVGTLAYMSPEQALGRSDEADARSDVYALGVVAHEVLTGQLPHDLESLPLPQALAAIAEAEVTHLSSADARLRGDIDAIVGRCLEKEPRHRYADAGELAADWERHLEDRPIVARRPSLIERVQRFARANRAFVAALLAIGLALVAATAFTGALAQRESRARAKADRSAALAEAREQAALRAAYRATVAAAGVAMRDGATDAARHGLANTPEELRGWEWRHLHARLDDSLAVVQLDGEWPGPPYFGADASLVYLVAPRHVPQRPLLEWDPATGSLRDVALLQAGSSIHVPTRALRPAILSFVRRVGVSGSHVDFVSTETGRLLARLPHCGTSRDAWQPQWLSRDGLRAITSVQRGLETITCTCDSSAGTVVHSTSVPTRPTFLHAVSGTLATSPQGWHDLKDGRQVGSFGDEAQFGVAAFSPDGRRIAAVANDLVLRCWNVETGELLGTQPLRPSWQVPLKFSPDGTTLAVGTEDGIVRLLAADLSRELTTLHGHAAAVNALEFSADGSRLASRAADWEYRLWDTSRRDDVAVLRGHDGYVYGAAFSPDGRRIASASWDRTIRIWDAASGEVIAVLSIPSADGFSSYGPRHLAWGPDGTQLVLRYGESVVAFDADTGREVANLILQGGTGDAVSPHGELGWLTASSGRGLEQLDPLTWKASPVLPAVRAMSFALSPDERIVAAVVEGGLATWELATGRHVQAFALDSSEPLPWATERRLVFSPDGRFIACGGGDVRVFSTDTGELRASLPGHGAMVHGLSFSPDGTRIATAGMDSAIRVWDTSSWEPLIQLWGHESYVWTLSFSPDGETLLSSSGDGTLRLWGTTSRRELTSLDRQRRGLIAQVQPVIERAFAELSDASAVAEHLRSVAELSVEEREVALQLTLRRSAHGMFDPPD